LSFPLSNGHATPNNIFSSMININGLKKRTRQQKIGISVAAGKTGYFHLPFVNLH